MQPTITTWYLEMLDPSWLRPAAPAAVPPATREALTVVRAEVACPELNRFLYTAVGGDWCWTDRLAWTYDGWLTYISRPGFETWVAYLAGTPAGYFELQRTPRDVSSERLSRGSSGGSGRQVSDPSGGTLDDVEIASFGLLPWCIGRGLGGYLLTVAVERAWAQGPRRVWVHTCSLDGPYALANYEARGFRVYRRETAVEPRVPSGPWPGADRPRLPSPAVKG